MKKSYDNLFSIRTQRPQTSSLAATTTTSRPRGTTKAMDPRMRAVANHIMSMNAADIRHAVMEPIMMGFGALMATVGAYLVMVMTEVNAANAAAFALAAG